MYLKIENPGVADPTAFTLLGASTSRDSQNSNTIGKFGSGNKHGVAVLLRNELAPIVFAGNLRMTFGTTPVKVETGLCSKSFERVQVKYNGKDRDGKSKTATEDLGFVLEYGATDWLSVELALREFVSNSLDRAIEEDEALFATQWIRNNNINEATSAAKSDYQKALVEHRKTARPYDNVTVEIVADNQVRAKEGTTRVFVPLNDDVQKFYDNLGKWFLHFSEPDLLYKTILPKNGRNLSEGRKAAVIYRRGVRVREFESSDIESLFDYNLENIELDESRKVDDWRVKHAATQAFQYAEPEQVATFLTTMLEGKTYWEHTFDQYGWQPNWNEKPVEREQRQKNWNEAVSSLGDNIVIGTAANYDFATRKGYKVLQAPEAFVSAARDYNLPTVDKVLTQDDREGRTIIDASPDAIAAVDFMWEVIVAANMNNNKEKPPVKCFRQSMNGGSITWGFCRNGDGIYFNEDLGTTATVEGGRQALSQMFLSTAMEELAHWVTEATDNSRDFQDWIINLAVKLAVKLHG
jgi:hypothetical protein